METEFENYVITDGKVQTQRGAALVQDFEGKYNFTVNEVAALLLKSAEQSFLKVINVEFSNSSLEEKVVINVSASKGISCVYKIDLCDFIQFYAQLYCERGDAITLTRK